MWVLLKFLPIVIGNAIPHSDPHWLFLLHLSELVDLIFAPWFTVGMVAYLREFIADHLLQFKKLFGRTLRLRSKHHFLVHFPTAILLNGPCVGFNCLRYELKNLFFKRSAGVVCNFTNVSKTLGSRPQYNAFHRGLSKQFLRNTVLVGNKTSEHLPAGELRFFAQLHEQLQVDSSQDVVIATKISVASVIYRAGTFVQALYTFSASGYPVFGCVECFVNIPGGDVSSCDA